MSFEDKINTILKENMTEVGFLLWSTINEKLPNIWDKPTSSTKKYHKRKDGSVPCVGEHTYEMINAAVKVMSMFDISKQTSDCDTLLFAISLHDMLKYGKDGNRLHTTNDHDQLAGNFVKSNREIFLRILNENQTDKLEDSVRYHSGRWSTDANIKTFDFSDRHPLAMFVHTLDMMSTKDVLKY